MSEHAYRQAEQRLWESVGAQPDELRVRLPWLGTHVRIQELGEGPSVLFIHGSPNSGSTWAPLAARLRGIRCLLLDRPGTGLSEPLPEPGPTSEELTGRLVVDVLDSLDLPEADLVVSSLGGYLALHAAATHPDRIGRTVQMGSPGPVEGAPTPAMVRLMGIPGIAWLMGRLPANRRAGRITMRQIGHRKSLEEGRISDEFFDWYYALQRHTETMRNELAMMSDVVTLRGFNPQFQLTDELLAQAESPTYFLWGHDDTFGGQQLACRIVDAMPQAELEMMPDAGHLPWLDDPDRAALVVEGFLNATTAADA